MNSTLRALFAFAAPGVALVALGSGCAVASDLSAPSENIGTVTSGTLTVEDGADAGALPAPPSPPLADGGGAFEVPSIWPDAGEADAGPQPLGH